MHCTEGPSRPAFWAKGLVTSRVSLRCQKKTLKRQITNFFYDKQNIHCNFKIFANFLIIKLYTIMKQPWKFSNFKRSAVPSSMYLVLFFFSSLLLGRCDNQLFRNPAKFGPRIYTILCNIWIWFGAKPCRISAVHTCAIDRNLTHDATFRWALS